VVPDADAEANLVSQGGEGVESTSSSSSGGDEQVSGVGGGCDERYLRAVLIGGVRGLSVAVSLQPDVVEKIERWMAAHPCSS
jgi:hypothetical protein